MHHTATVVICRRAPHGQHAGHPTVPCPLKATTLHGFFYVPPCRLFRTASAQDHVAYTASDYYKAGWQAVPAHQITSAAKLVFRCVGGAGTRWHSFSH